MELSLGQAAKAAGVGKTTLARAIQSGKMSATRREDGSYAVDPAELTRAYPPRSEAAEMEATPGYAGHRTSAPRNLDETEIRICNAALAAELKGLRETLDEMRKRVDDIGEDRDSWRDQAQRLLLAAPLVTPPPSRRTAHRGWWPFRLTA
jgi:hypothetical protein